MDSSVKRGLREGFLMMIALDGLNWEKNGELWLIPKFIIYVNTIRFRLSSEFLDEIIF